MGETKLCRMQESCPLLLAAVEAKMEAEAKSRTVAAEITKAREEIAEKLLAANELWRLTVRCRTAQRNYYRIRDRQTLISSKEAEKRLDDYIEFLRQPSLPLQEGSK